MQGMLKRLDRHSSYFSSESYEKFEQDLEAEYGGIGAYVQNDPDDGLFTITRPIYSGPAYRAGLGTDDKIVRIGDWPTVGEPTDEVIKRLKGKPGTPVKLYVWRRCMDAALIDRPTEDMAVVEVERAQIAIPGEPRAAPGRHRPRRVHQLRLGRGRRGARRDPGADRGVGERQAHRRHPRPPQQHRAPRPGRRGGRPVPPARQAGGQPRAASCRSRASRRGAARRSTPRPRSRCSSTASRPRPRDVRRPAGSRPRDPRGRSFGKGSVQRLIPMPREPEDEYSDENRNGRRDNWRPSPRTGTATASSTTPRASSSPSSATACSAARSTASSTRRATSNRSAASRPTSRSSCSAASRGSCARSVSSRPASSGTGSRSASTAPARRSSDSPTTSTTRRSTRASTTCTTLDTTLSRDDVRFLLRIEVRRRVQDVRGALT